MNREREQDILLQEIRYRERSAKIRGLPEKEKERLLDSLVPETAKYLDLSEESVDLQIKKIFRINSTFAKERNLSRDTAICFTNSRIREKLCQLSYEEKMVIEGKEIEIFRDMPAYVLKKRQDYRFLTQLLQRKEIRYRWEKVEGIMVTYRHKRYKIHTIERAKEFYRKLKAQMGKEHDGELKKEGGRGEGGPWIGDGKDLLEQRGVGEEEFPQDTDQLSLLGEGEERSETEEI